MCHSFSDAAKILCFNKDHENTDMQSTEILSLVSICSSFTNSCCDSTDGATIFHFIKLTALK